MMGFYDEVEKERFEPVLIHYGKLTFKTGKYLKSRIVSAIRRTEPVFKNFVYEIRQIFRVRNISFCLHVFSKSTHLGPFFVTFSVGTGVWVIVLRDGRGG